MELLLPQGKLILSRGKLPLAGLVAGGRGPDPNWLRAAMGDMPLYGADKGADYCVRAGLYPVLACGDRDSGHAGSWEKIKAHGTKVLTYLVNKDATDLSLLLKEMPPVGTLLASGIWGGRADHLYANLLTLLQYQKRTKTPVVLLDEWELLIFLEKGDCLCFEVKKAPKALSLLPFSPDCEVSIDGVRWPLEHAVISSENPYAVSNKMAGSKTTASCHAGIAGFYLTYKE
ncbi:thiamine diphosphokinase [uncultured Acidaminococcus sp.]|jgi:thiamine pyrophosphokinase|uniref:thiamine diphosphokinase n=1 Tax=Acidaminococcus sp. TaxID=1872103 RepID=UPI002676F130|nr:thiamine diphosphokinase [uncultured Acidaminococcus sp.]